MWLSQAQTLSLLEESWEPSWACSGTQPDGMSQQVTQSRLSPPHLLRPQEPDRPPPRLLPHPSPPGHPLPGPGCGPSVYRELGGVSGGKGLAGGRDKPPFDPSHCVAGTGQGALPLKSRDLAKRQGTQASWAVEGRASGGGFLCLQTHTGERPDEAREGVAAVRAAASSPCPAGGHSGRGPPPLGPQVSPGVPAELPWACVLWGFPVGVPLGTRASPPPVRKWPVNLSWACA